MKYKNNWIVNSYIVKHFHETMIHVCCHSQPGFFFNEMYEHMGLGNKII